MTDAVVRFPRLPKLKQPVPFGSNLTPEERITRLEKFIDDLLPALNQGGTDTADYLGRLVRNAPLPWTPVLTFATPGDVNVVYSVQEGAYMKLGRLTVLQWVILTSTFTHTTAAGNLQITGVPFAASTSIANYEAYGTMAFQGITKAGFTQFTPKITGGASLIGTAASGSGIAGGNVTAADMPTGGTVLLVGSIVYNASA